MNKVTISNRNKPIFIKNKVAISLQTQKIQRQNKRKIFKPVSPRFNQTNQFQKNNKIKYKRDLQLIKLNKILKNKRTNSQIKLNKVPHLNKNTFISLIITKTNLTIFDLSFLQIC